MIKHFIKRNEQTKDVFEESAAIITKFSKIREFINNNLN